jgi:hypothetical protein
VATSQLYLTLPGERLTVFSLRASGYEVVAINRENREIDADSRRNRANRESSKFPFEFKSPNFRRVGDTVLDGTTKKFMSLDQSVMISQNNRVEVRARAAVSR